MLERIQRISNRARNFDLRRLIITVWNSVEEYRKNTDDYTRTQTQPVIINVEVSLANFESRRQNRDADRVFYVCVAVLERRTVNRKRCVNHHPVKGSLRQNRWRRSHSATRWKRNWKGRRRSCRYFLHFSPSFPTEYFCASRGILMSVTW